MIKLEHVSKSYSAGIPALNDVSLNIKEGELWNPFFRLEKEV